MKIVLRTYDAIVFDPVDIRIESSYGNSNNVTYHIAVELANGNKIYIKDKNNCCITYSSYSEAKTYLDAFVKSLCDVVRNSICNDSILMFDLNNISLPN